MKPFRFACWIPLVLSGWSPICPAQGTFEFNSAAELAGAFVERPANEIQYVWSAAPGVAGTSGRVDVANPFVYDTLYLKSSIGGYAGVPAEVSMVFSFDPTGISLPPRTGLNAAELGFNDGTDRPLGPFGAPLGGITTGLVFGEYSNWVQLRIVSQDGLGTFNSTTPLFELSAGLYQLKNSWNVDQNGQWQVMNRLLSAGLDGNGPFTEIRQLSATFTNQSLASGTMWLGLNARFGVNWLDNVAIVPEPATACLIFAGLVFIGFFSRGWSKARHSG